METITKHDLEGLLKFLQYGTEDSVVSVRNEYLQELVVLAILSFEDRKEMLDYEC